MRANLLRLKLCLYTFANPKEFLDGCVVGLRDVSRSGMCDRRRRLVFNVQDTLV
jgi:hypothetical protein